MKFKPSIYLDTSVINFLFADDAPEKMLITNDFFNSFVRLGIYDSYISAFVIDEIEKTPDIVKRSTLLSIIDEYPITILKIENPDELAALAKQYVEKRIVPRRNYFDAYHIALSVLNEIDYLVSWNFRHLANITRERKVIAVNYENGFTSNFRITTPMELMNYENDDLKSSD